MAYQGTDRSARAKALGGVVAVHLLLGLIILTGLNVDTVHRAVERLKTFDINEEAPPPPVPEPPPPPSPEPAAPDAPAPPNLKSEATPVVAPKPPIALPIPLPMTAAERPAEASDRTSGAASVAGPGTGAGGQGSGRGGGGSGGAGAGDGRTPAQLIEKIPNRDYRRIAAGRMPQGSAVITFRVEPSGRPADCRIVRSSGDRQVDAAICPIAMERLRFRPARDRDGRPIAQQITYVPTWRVR